MAQSAVSLHSQAESATSKVAPVACEIPPSSTGKPSSVVSHPHHPSRLHVLAVIVCILAANWIDAWSAEDVACHVYPGRQQSPTQLARLTVDDYTTEILAIDGEADWPHPGCVDGFYVAPGWHEVQFTYKAHGYSLVVASYWHTTSLIFEADAGHRYRVGWSWPAFGYGTYEEWIRDETTDTIVASSLAEKREMDPTMLQALKGDVNAQYEAAMRSATADQRLDLLCLAATGGHSGAALQLAAVYAMGLDGVTPRPTEAYLWALHAKALGAPNAEKVLGRLTSLITPSQRLNAEQKSPQLGRREFCKAQGIVR